MFRRGMPADLIRGVDAGSPMTTRAKERVQP